MSKKRISAIQNNTSSNPIIKPIGIKQFTPSGHRDQNETTITTNDINDSNQTNDQLIKTIKSTTATVVKENYQLPAELVQEMEAYILAYRYNPENTNKPKLTKTQIVTQAITEWLKNH